MAGAMRFYFSSLTMDLWAGPAGCTTVFDHIARIVPTFPELSPILAVRTQVHTWSLDYQSKMNRSKIKQN